MFPEPIDPIIYTIQIGDFSLPIRWYGLLVMFGALCAAFYAAWYFRRKRQDPNIVWDSMIWILIAGLVGARIWFVVADMIGGDSRYLDDPTTIFRVDQGGLNILGGVIFAVAIGWYYARRYKVDFWLLADAIGPGYLIGQAVGRLANFINQELYGPPTDLPWGIPIQADYRIDPWRDLTAYPIETTLFHPTFAYEMVWNLLAAGIITFLILRRGDKIATGVIAGCALLATGIGRAVLESNFRPDQPEFFGLGISTSMLLSIIFALVGLFIILVRSGRISVPFMEAGSLEYTRRSTRRPPASRKVRRNKA